MSARWRHHRHPEPTPLRCWRGGPIGAALRGLAIAAALALAGCQVAPVKPPIAPPAAPHTVFEPARFESLPGWRDDDLSAAWPAFLESCKALAARTTTLPA
ncbi:MAG: hypothetical protein ACREX6_00620, partial [Casimicrobiaceae bacterium]